MSALVLDLFGKDDTPEQEDDESLSTSQLGRYAEFIVCAELTKLGYWVVHVDAPGFDLVLSANDRTYRVQVKGSSTTHDGRRIWRTRIAANATRGKDARKRPLDRRDADLVALFDHVTSKTIFVPVHGTTSEINVPIAQIVASDSHDTLLSALRQSGGIS